MMVYPVRSISKMESLNLIFSRIPENSVLTEDESLNLRVMLRVIKLSAST